MSSFVKRHSACLRIKEDPLQKAPRLPALYSWLLLLIRCRIQGAMARGLRLCQADTAVARGAVSIFKGGPHFKRCDVRP